MPKGDRAGDPVSDPERKSHDEEHDGGGGNDLGLLGRQGDAEGERARQEQHVLLKRVVEHPAVDLGRGVFLVQRRINGFAEKPVVADGDDADQQRDRRKRVGLQGEG